MSGLLVTVPNGYSGTRVATGSGLRHTEKATTASTKRQIEACKLVKKEKTT